MGIRVFVLDDHHVALDGIRRQLEAAGLNVVGTALNGSEAIERLSSLATDVLLLDVRMIELDGLATLERIRVTHPGLATVMFSSYENPTYIARAVTLGVREYVLKSLSGRELVEAIQRAHLGHPSPPDSNLSRVKAVMHREVDVKSLPEDMPLSPKRGEGSRNK